MVFKKRYCLFFIIFGPAQAAEVNHKKKIPVQLAQEKIFKVSEAEKNLLIRFSPFINDTYSNCEHDDSGLVLDTINKKTFKRIVTILNSFELKKQPGDYTDEIVLPSLSNKALFSLLKAAQFLNIKPIIKQGTGIIARKIIEREFDDKYIKKDKKKAKTFASLNNDIKYEASLHFRDYIIQKLIPKSIVPTKKTIKRDMKKENFGFDSMGKIVFVDQDDETLFAYDVRAKRKEIISPEISTLEKGISKIRKYSMETLTIVDVRDEDGTLKVGFSDDGTSIICKKPHTIQIVSDDDEIIMQEDYSRYAKYCITAISPKGRYIIFADKDDNLIIVDRFMQKQDVPFSDHEGLEIDFSSDEHFLIKNDRHAKKITLYDLIDDNEIRSFDYKGRFRKILITKDNKYLIIVSAYGESVTGGEIDVYDIASAKKITGISNIQRLYFTSQCAMHDYQMLMIEKQDSALDLLQWDLPCSVFNDLCFDQLVYLIIAERNKELFFSEKPGFETIRENLPDLVIKTMNDRTAQSPYAEDTFYKINDLNCLLNLIDQLKSD